jgi:hypothetical protein
MVHSRQELADLAGAIAPDELAVAILRRFDGLSHEEVAEVLGVPYRPAHRPQARRTTGAPAKGDVSMSADLIHPSYLELDRVPLGACSPATRAHVAACPACAAHLERIAHPDPLPGVGALAAG